MHPNSIFSFSPTFFDNSTGFRTRFYWAQLITIAIVTPLVPLNKFWTFSAVRGKHGVAATTQETVESEKPTAGVYGRPGGNLRTRLAIYPESRRLSVTVNGHSSRNCARSAEGRSPSAAGSTPELTPSRGGTLYLKSLTLRGFKSFASATTLNFEPGITCVVGPNGSGKSNVVDALSWVMGEQGAKSLRGGKMEDVIFAGTSGRAPLGRAEVVLTIDNSDGALHRYSEVTISRTMFRNGGSEYAINGTAARLLDIHDLLSDSGIGREMHVIVGQGQLDSILQATPEIRRGFIEEAAGVLKHRKRKEKAVRKLEACEANLNRLSDLINEIRRQLKPLGRQAEVARKAAIIQAEARDARARLLADDLLQATQALQPSSRTSRR